MYQLLKLFFNICLFKKGPQDIPVSTGLFRFLILLYACVSFLNYIISSNAMSAAFQTLVQILLILSLARIILFVAKKQERYQQTANALIATDTIISFFALPAMATLMGLGSGFAFVTIIVLMLWHWTVSGYIIGNALDQPFTFGLGVAFLYILVSYQVMALIFPEITVE